MEILSWWFQLVPLWSAMSLRILFIAGLMLLIVGAIARWIGYRRFPTGHAHMVVDRITLWGIVLGALLFGYWFMAFENIPLVSARFWLIVFTIGAMVWLWAIVRSSRVKPVEAMEKKVHDENVKYLRMRR